MDASSSRSQSRTQRQNPRRNDHDQSPSPIFDPNKAVGKICLPRVPGYKGFPSCIKDEVQGPLPGIGRSACPLLTPPAGRGFRLFATSGFDLVNRRLARRSSHRAGHYEGQSIVCACEEVSIYTQDEGRKDGGCCKVWRTRKGMGCRDLECCS